MRTDLEGDINNFKGEINNMELEKVRKGWKACAENMRYGLDAVGKTKSEAREKLIKELENMAAKNEEQPYIYHNGGWYGIVWTQFGNYHYAVGNDISTIMHRGCTVGNWKDMDDAIAAMKSHVDSLVGLKE